MESGDQDPSSSGQPDEQEAPSPAARLKLLRKLQTPGPKKGEEQLWLPRTPAWLCVLTCLCAQVFSTSAEYHHIW